MGIRSETYLYEIFVRGGREGIQGAHQRIMTIHVDEETGRVYYPDPDPKPEPLDPEMVKGLIDDQVPALLREVEELRALVAAMEATTTEREALATAEVEAARATMAALTVELEARADAPEPIDEDAVLAARAAAAGRSPT